MYAYAHINIYRQAAERRFILGSERLWCWLPPTLTHTSEMLSETVGCGASHGHERCSYVFVCMCVCV